jgi:hypothetical protein
VDREFEDVGVVELPSAAAADPGDEFERLGAVALLAFVTRAAGLGDDAVQAVVIGIDALADGRGEIVGSRRRGGEGGRGRAVRA